jgi:hypothetical protein
MALRGGKILSRHVRCRRARDMRCRHLRSWGLRSCNLRPCDLRCRLRPCDLRRRGARGCNMRRSARCHLRRGRPRGRGRGPSRRSARCRTVFSSGILLCGSCHRNGDGQCGGQRHSSSQIHHCSSSTSAELRFRHSTG